MSTNTPSRQDRWRSALWALLVIVFLTPISFNIYDHLTRPRNTLPTERDAILQLLTQKFTGPQYFQNDTSASSQPMSSDKVYISPASAKSQVNRIASERKFTPEKSLRLNDIITRMTEPSPSRVVGENRVNLLMLNLALDES